MHRLTCGEWVDATPPNAEFIYGFRQAGVEIRFGENGALVGED